MVAAKKIYLSEEALYILAIMGTPEERAATNLQLQQAQVNTLGQQATTAAERLNLAASQEVRKKLERYGRNIGVVFDRSVYRNDSGFLVLSFWVLDARFS